MAVDGRWSNHPAVTLYARARDVAAAVAHRLWARMRWAGAIGPQDRLAAGTTAFGDGTLICVPARGLVRRGAHRPRRRVPHRLQRQPVRRHGPRPAAAPGRHLPRAADRRSVLIGRGSHLVAHRSVVIGDDVMTGPHCYVTDQNHVYADPDTPIGQQWPADDPVEIGAGSWLGRRCRHPAGDQPRPEHGRRRRRRGARRVPRPRRPGRGPRHGRAPLRARRRAGNRRCATCSSTPPEGWPVART